MPKYSLPAATMAEWRPWAWRTMRGFLVRISGSGGFIQQISYAIRVGEPMARPVRAAAKADATRNCISESQIWDKNRLRLRKIRGRGAQ